jgi:hypothetical protein
VLSRPTGDRRRGRLTPVAPTRSRDDPVIRAASSQGRTRPEARANVIDALQTVLTPDDQLAGSAPSHDDEMLTLTIAE